MLHALNKGKFRSNYGENADAGAYSDAEDHLTAAVLSRLCYLQRRTAEEIVKRSIVDQTATIATISVTENPENNDLSVQFWPRYKDATKNQNTVEPDAILRVGRHVYIVEANRYDTRGQNSEQLAREWLAWGSDMDETSARQHGDIYALLLLGGVASRQTFATIVGQINSLLAEAATDIACGLNVAWISWESLADTVRRKIFDVSGPEARVLQDIDLALTLHGYGAWLTMDALDKSWALRRSRQPMAIEWPTTFFGAAPISATALEPIRSWSLAANELRLVNSQPKAVALWLPFQEVSK